MYAAELLSACGRTTPSNAGVPTYAIGEAFENCTAQSKAATTPSILAGGRLRGWPEGFSVGVLFSFGSSLFSQRHPPLPNNMGNSCGQCQKPPASQAEVQSSVPAAGLSSQPTAQCSLVLNDANLLTMILILAASTGLHRAPKIFMMEACNTTIGEIALQKRDELGVCIRQVCCQASTDARG